jgi:hypothetical protein
LLCAPFLVLANGNSGGSKTSFTLELECLFAFTAGGQNVLSREVIRAPLCAFILGVIVMVTAI